MPTKFITTLGENIDKGRKLEFLWDPYIPRGRITVLDGDPGLGKSFVTLDICARITAGIPFPNLGDAAEGDRPAPVLICNCEDEVATTLLPRLRGAKADLKLVHFRGLGSGRQGRHAVPDPAQRRAVPGGSGYEDPPGDHRDRPDHGLSR